MSLAKWTELVHDRAFEEGLDYDSRLMGAAYVLSCLDDRKCTTMADLKEQLGHLSVADLEQCIVILDKLHFLSSNQPPYKLSILYYQKSLNYDMFQHRVKQLAFSEAENALAVAEKELKTTKSKLEQAIHDSKNVAQIRAREQLNSPLIGSLMTEIVLVFDMLKDAKMTMAEIQEWAKTRNWEDLLKEYNLLQYATDYVKK